MKLWYDDLMVRKFLIILGIVAIAVAVWLYIGVSRVISTENDVKKNFKDIVQYYVSMEQEYVAPLIASEALQDGDKKALQEIGKQMRDLGQTIDLDQQYTKLLVLQKTIIVFIGSSSYPESFMADNRLAQWSKNATNFGTASLKIKTYNESLSAYNTSFKSTAGKLAGVWKRWSHHQYLGINGSQEDETIITF